MQLDFEKLEVKFSWHKTPKLFRKVDYANGTADKCSLKVSALAS